MTSLANLRVRFWSSRAFSFMHGRSCTKRTAMKTGYIRDPMRL
jgi:hypothetical protein